MLICYNFLAQLSIAYHLKKVPQLKMKIVLSAVRLWLEDDMSKPKVLQIA